MESTIKVRVSDNVLEEKHWPVVELTFDGRAVVGTRQAAPHGLSPVEGSSFIGMTERDLAEWSRYDSTGSHPEEYHEVLIWHDGERIWRDYVTESQVHRSLTVVQSDYCRPVCPYCGSDDVHVVALERTLYMATINTQLRCVEWGDGFDSYIESEHCRCSECLKNCDLDALLKASIGE